LATGAAAIIAASTQSPFADPEHATWPAPRLRLIQVAAFVLAAAGLLGLARLGHDPLAAIRNLAGFTGLALITGTLISAPLAWITPLAYVLYCGAQIDIQAVSLLSSPAPPPPPQPPPPPPRRWPPPAPVPPPSPASAPAIASPPRRDPPDSLPRATPLSWREGGQRVGPLPERSCACVTTTSGTSARLRLSGWRKAGCMPA